MSSRAEGNISGPGGVSKISQSMEVDLQKTPTSAVQTGKRKLEAYGVSPKLGGGPKTKIVIEKVEQYSSDLLFKLKTTTKDDVTGIYENILAISEQIKLFAGMLMTERDTISDLYDYVDKSKQAKLGQDLMRCKDCNKKFLDEERMQKRLEEDIQEMMAMDIREPAAFKRYSEMMVDLAGRKWKDDMFQTELNRDLAGSLKGDSMAIFMKDREDKTSPLIKKVASRYPDVEDLLATDEKRQLLEQVIKVNNQVRESRLYLLKFDPNNYKAEMVECITAMVNGTCIALTEGLDWEFARKVIELMNKKAKKQVVQLVVPESYKTGGNSNEAGNRKKIVLKLTNSDLPGKMGTVMKELKRGLKVEEGIVIEGMKNDVDKDLVEIRAKEGQEGALAKFIEQVKSNVGEKAEVSVSSIHTGLTTLIIRNIDYTVEQQEVLKGIEDIAGKNRTVNLLSLRPNFRKDAQVAKVAVDRETSDLLLSKKLVKIGWLHCPIDLMVDPVQCYKCLKHGHRSTDCTEQVNLSGRCRKCLGENHLARDCTNKPKCADCGGDHHTGVMGCDKFKNLVNREREKREKDQMGWEVVGGAGRKRGQVQSTR